MLLTRGLLRRKLVPQLFRAIANTKILQLDMADGDTLEVHQEQIGG